MAFGDKQNRATLPFIKNGRVVFDVPLGDKILNMKLVLRGTIPATGGTTSGTVFGEGGPINLIDRIIVHANPMDTRYPGGQIVDSSPRSLLRYAAYQHKGKFIGEQGGSTLGGGAANAGYNVYLSIPLYFADPTLRARDVSTALNTDPGSYASVQVEIRTADILNCFTGNDRAWDLSGLVFDLVDDRVTLPGDTNVLFQEDHELLIGASVKRQLDPGMPKDGAFLCWSILEQQGAAQTLASTLLNRLTVQGNPIDYDKFAQDIVQQMLDDEWIDASQNLAGLKFVDWADGVLGNSLIASSLDAKFDVNNPSGANADSLLIYTRRLFVPAPASN